MLKIGPLLQSLERFLRKLPRVVRHENGMDLRRAKTQEPLNKTWAGKQSEQPRSFQSPETYLLLTFPFIERACVDRYRTQVRSLGSFEDFDSLLFPASCGHFECKSIEAVRPFGDPALAGNPGSNPEILWSNFGAI